MAIAANFTNAATENVAISSIFFFLVVNGALDPRKNNANAQRN